MLDACACGYFALFLCQKFILYFLTLMQDSITQKIHKRIQAKGRGALFTPKGFLDLGGRDAVDKALSRLVQQNKIRRLTRGMYDYPKQHPVLGLLTPSPDDIAALRALQMGDTLQVTGAKAANLLGISTQVPAQNIYLTSGPARRIQVGKQQLLLRHAGTKVMAGAGQWAGVTLQAIRFMGAHHLNQDVIRRIQRKLPSSDKRALKKLAKFAPDWARPAITEITHTV